MTKPPSSVVQQKIDELVALGELVKTNRTRNGHPVYVTPRYAVPGELRVQPSHLKSQRIDFIALGLSEDVYGANGDLADAEIDRRLIEAVHGETNDSFRASGQVPVDVVAHLLRRLWEFEDRLVMQAMIDAARDATV
jgi:hypothetical protein